LSFPLKNVSPDLESRLRACAEIIVRTGLNLQPGQSLLIAEPYELQGVSREASALVDAVSAETIAAECPQPHVIWGDAPRLRQYAEQADWSGFTKLVAGHADRMKDHLAIGGALLFPITSFPHLMDGIAVENVSEQRRIAWEHFGPIAQRLTHRESQWTLVPAPSSAWADATFSDLPAEKRLASLEETVFAALRVEQPSAAWQNHLTSLQRQRDELNARRHKIIRYQGPGTDLTVKLPIQHRWCTAQLITKAGVTFVANLPTEEVFTAPDRNSAEGIVRVSRPVNYGGTVIDGIELDFHHGVVVQARARTGAALLERLLNTDEGSSRLGEVAVVGKPAANAAADSRAAWQSSRRLFYHTLLDENAANHIALGESYPFCTRALFASGLNRSLVHVDLPLDAEVTFS